MIFGSKEKTMTSGEVHDIQLFVRGDLRNDGWISSWREEQERRRKEEHGDRKFVTAPQIKVRQERVVNPAKVINPKTPKRLCELCPTVIRASNKSGRCVKHLIKFAQKGDPRLCPPCGRPIRQCNSFGLCKLCQNKYRRMIHQKRLVICDQCPRKLHANNTTGKCVEHAAELHKRRDNAAKREKRQALRVENMKVAA